MLDDAYVQVRCAEWETSSASLGQKNKKKETFSSAPHHVCVIRQDNVVVVYAVTVAVDGAGVSNDQLDYLTLQSNRVENSYRRVTQLSPEVYTTGAVHSVNTEGPHGNAVESGETIAALQQNTHMPLS